MGDRKYSLEYLVLWAKVIAIYLVGGYILGMIGGNGFDRDLGIALALVVFGTTFFNKVVPFNLFGNHDAVIIFWILKILLSFIIGIFAFPIVNLFYLINIIIKIVRSVNSKQYD